MNRFCLISSVVIALLSSDNCEAAIIASWDFNDADGLAPLEASFSDTANFAGVTASDISVGAGLNLVTTTANGNTFGGGSDPNEFTLGGARDAFGFPDDNNNADLAGALAQNNYISFTITPDSGQIFDLTSLTFDYRVNRVRDAANRYTVFSSVDGFTNGNQIAATVTNSNANAFTAQTVDLSSLTGIASAVEFRIFIHGGDRNASSFTGFDNFVVNAVPVPEPGSLVSLVFGLFSLLFFRRKRLVK